jgi:hypothetical protein
MIAKAEGKIMPGFSFSLMSQYSGVGEYGSKVKAPSLSGEAADVTDEGALGDRKQGLFHREFEFGLDGIDCRVGKSGRCPDQFGLDIFVGIGDAPLPGIYVFGPDAAVFLVVFFEEAQAVPVHTGIGITAFAQKEIAFIDVKGYDAHGKDDEFVFHEFIDLRPVADGILHFRDGIVDDVLQFMHQLIVFDQLLIEDLEFFYLYARQFLGELFLQVFLVLPEGGEVVIVEDDICQLGVELVLRKVLMDLLEIGQQGVLFQFEINIAIGKPGIG